MPGVIYLVQPTHFDVQYEINPWMVGNISSVNKLLAMQQWYNLYTLLSRLGVRTVVLPEAPTNCPDAVFIANAGLIINNDFFCSSFKHACRIPEEEYFAEYFTSLKYDTYCLPNDVNFEGAGDALFSTDGKILFLGNGLRTDNKVYEYIRELAYKFKTVQLDLIDPDFYHLDTCFCPLDTGYLLWNERAFSKESADKIREIYTLDKRIQVGYEDANSFGCNAISVGKSIIMPLVSDALQQILRSSGHEVHCVDMSEFIKSGGGPKCCTLLHN